MTYLSLAEALERLRRRWQQHRYDDHRVELARLADAMSGRAARPTSFRSWMVLASVDEAATVGLTSHSG